MLTSVQKEILQSLINLYREGHSTSVKGEEIAELMNRNPGTIRNQMQSLRSLGLVKGVPGPRGGYKPTIEAYQTLNISSSGVEKQVSLFKDGKELKGISVAKIEFTSIPHPAECEAKITILGSIKELDLGDKISIGPTPVNKLTVTGNIVGRDDMGNVLLIDISTIKSVPKLTVMDIASQDLLNLNKECTVRDAAKFLYENKIEGAPIIERNRVIGIVTLTDIIYAFASNRENDAISNFMSEKVITVDEDVMLSDAIDIINEKKIGRLIVLESTGLPCGIVTKTDLLDIIAGY